MRVAVGMSSDVKSGTDLVGNQGVAKICPVAGFYALSHGAFGPLWMGLRPPNGPQMGATGGYAPRTPKFSICGIVLLLLLSNAISLCFKLVSRRLFLCDLVLLSIRGIVLFLLLSDAISLCFTLVSRCLFLCDLMLLSIRNKFLSCVDFFL